jgi:DNA-binding transcriptional MerR regulator
MSDRLLTIGELARRAGVAPSALRYWEELGLLPTATKISGQRRYPESAVGLVGIIRLLRDVGFSLAEQKALMASRAVALDDWQRLARRKLAELDDQIAKAQTTREAIDHALRCPHEDILECPNFASVPAARLTGQPLHQAHPHSPLPTAPHARPRVDLRLQHSGKDWIPAVASRHGFRKRDQPPETREQRPGGAGRGADDIPVVPLTQLPTPPTSPCRCPTRFRHE